MLKNFPPKDASKSELALFQKQSDELLKPVSSTAKSFASTTKKLVSTLQIPALPEEQYDISKLKNVTNLSSDIMNAMSAFQDEVQMLEDATRLEPEPPENAEVRAGLESSIKAGKMKKDTILEMIFKIIPSGVNIFKRLKTVAIGFKETASGTVNLTKNLAILSTVIGSDTIEFGYHLFVYLFKLISRGVSLLYNFPKCLPFYFIFVLLLFVFSFILSFLFIVDVFLMIKYFAGISCIELFLLFLTTTGSFFKQVFSSSPLFKEYAETTLKICYRCDELSETDEFYRVSSRMFDTIFVKIPKNIGGPVGEALTGIGHIMSFLDLS